MTETEAESQQDFQLGRGAVLYNDRRDSRDGRDLWHVTGRWVNVDTGRLMYELWDASHTRRQYYSDEDVLADFVPAGWLLEVGRKPVTQLRSIGVESNVPDREPEYYFSES